MSIEFNPISILVDKDIIFTEDQRLYIKRDAFDKIVNMIKSGVPEEDHIDTPEDKALYELSKSMTKEEFYEFINKYNIDIRTH